MNQRVEQKIKEIEAGIGPRVSGISDREALYLLALCKKQREALEEIAETDLTEKGPTAIWLIAWRNRAKHLADAALYFDPSEDAGGGET